MFMGRRSHYTIFYSTLRDTIVPLCIFLIISQKIVRYFCKIEAEIEILRIINSLGGNCLGNVEANLGIFLVFILTGKCFLKLNYE